MNEICKVNGFRHAIKSLKFPQIHHIVEVLSHHRDCGFASRSGIGMCDLVRCFTEFLGPARCTKSEGECLNYADCMGEIPCQSEHWSCVVQGFKKWTLRQNHIPQAQITWIRPSGGPQPTIFISTSHWSLDHYSPYWSLDHYSLPTYLSICTYVFAGVWPELRKHGHMFNPNPPLHQMG